MLDFLHVSSANSDFYRRGGASGNKLRMTLGLPVYDLSPPPLSSYLRSREAHPRTLEPFADPTSTAAP